MSQHTPGPWHAEWVPWGQEQDLKVVAPGAHVLLTMNRTGYLLSEAVMEANARLIAAAPEMLEALKWLINADDEGEIEQGQYAKRGLALARALLARIEGDHG